MSDKVVFGNRQIPTLIALTEEEQARGLMFKKWPPPIMSFPYDEAKIRKFWMKNTISPLDIVFCRASKVVSIIEGKELSLNFVGPDEPSDLVVELPRGTAADLGIAVGTEVRLIYGLFSLAKRLELRMTKKATST